ncbi:hypothetical protein P171DRAFT_512322 [Karstenula rhodostoma CBS 690.94]|uniref:Uncharacterized protein n=1 Tax=Karstenula rhodostoma CBS 690.94 TaxID=1392251 RepID=A0A9P4UCB7_9PLEO|nr:hypothetical protein P171DRAFT_512322 [Karstenula rhodostoma CBS 690.94]
MDVSMARPKRKRGQINGHIQSPQQERPAADNYISSTSLSERARNSTPAAVGHSVLHPVPQSDSYVPEVRHNGEHCAPAPVKDHVAQRYTSQIAENHHAQRGPPEEVIRHGLMKLPVEIQSQILDHFDCRADRNSYPDHFTLRAMTLVNKALRPIGLQHLHRHTTANFDNKDSPKRALHLSNIINASNISMHLDIIVSTRRGQGHFQEWIKSVKPSRDLTVSFLDTARLTPKDDKWPILQVCTCERGMCQCVKTKTCNLSPPSFDAFSRWLVETPEVTSVDLPAWPVEEMWYEESADLTAGMDGHITLNTNGKCFKVGFVKDTPIDWISLLIYFYYDLSSTFELEMSDKEETFEDWEDLLIRIQSRIFTQRIRMNVSSLALRGKYLGFSPGTKMRSILDRNMLRNLTLENCSETSNLLSQLMGRLPSLHSFTLYEMSCGQAGDFHPELVERFLEFAPGVRELTLHHQRGWHAKSGNEAITTHHLPHWVVNWKRIGGEKLKKLHILRGEEPMTLEEILDIQKHCPYIEDFGCRLFGPWANWELFPNEGWYDEQMDEEGVKQYPIDPILRAIAGWPDLQRVSFGYEKIKLAEYKDRPSNVIDRNTIMDDNEDPLTRSMLYCLADLLHNSLKIKRAEVSLQLSRETGHPLIPTSTTCIRHPLAEWKLKEMHLLGQTGIPHVLSRGPWKGLHVRL